MPFAIHKRSCTMSDGQKGGFALVRSDTGKQVSCHVSEKDARAAARIRMEADVAGATNNILFNPVFLNQDPPRSVMIAPLGDVATENSKSSVDWTVTEESAKSIIASFDQLERDVIIDTRHESVLHPEVEAKAVGWVRHGTMRIEDVPQPSRYKKAIFADVVWLEDVADSIRKGEYRYLSPAFLVDKETKVAHTFLSTTLTNSPAIHGFPPLTVLNTIVPLLEDPKMDELLKALRSFLGVSEDADEGSLLKSLAEYKPKVDSNVASLSKSIKEVGKALGVEKEDADASELVAAVNRLRMDPEKVDKGQFTALQAQLGAAHSRLKSLEWDQILSVNARKISPAKREDYKKMWEKDSDQFKYWLSEMPELVDDASEKSKPVVAKSSRESVITASVKELAEKKASGVIVVCPDRDYVNDDLRIAKLPLLSNDEAAKLNVEA